MQLDQFRLIFDQSCNFVRLHGWVTQTDDKIDQLRELLKTEKNLWPQLQDHFLQSLQIVDSVEEKLLVLLLLSEIGVQPDLIANELFLHLQGRLSNDDSNFITKHFFHSATPVPDEIVYNIIKRNFISYQRAIFQALKISRYESEFSPAHVLLFLTQLMCRNNLNEQNRAMLYLLLSRLDVDLPETIAESVKRALINLADIIREVEERMEAVLSDTLLPNSITLETMEWEHLEATNENRIPKSLTPSNYPKGKSNELELGPQNAENQTAQSNPKKPEEIKGIAGDYFSQANIQGQKPGPEPIKNLPHLSEPAQVKSEPLPNQKSKGVAEKQGSPAINQTVPPPPNLNYDYNPVQLPRETESIPETAQILTQNGGSPEAQNFSIEFNRETEEMKNLVKTAQGEIKSEQKARPEAQTDEKDQKPAAETHGIKRKSVLWVILVLCVLGLLTVLVLMTPNKTSESQGLGPQVPETKTEDKKEPKASVNSPRLEAIGNFTVWYPKKTDTLWSFYQWAKSTDNDNAQLLKLAALSWPDFIKKILSQNVTLRVPDLIQPNNPINVFKNE